MGNLALEDKHLIGEELKSIGVNQHIMHISIYATVSISKHCISKKIGSYLLWSCDVNPLILKKLRMHSIIADSTLAYHQYCLSLAQIYSSKL